MQLLPCPACNHSLSPRATACPQCGEPLNPQVVDIVTDQPAKEASSPAPTKTQNPNVPKDTLPSIPMEGQKINDLQGEPSAQSPSKPQTEKPPNYFIITLAFLAIGAFGLYMYISAPYREAAERAEKREREEAFQKQQYLEQEKKSKEREVILKEAKEQAERLRRTPRLTFSLYGSRQFDETPEGKGIFETHIFSNGLPQRCVLIINPKSFTNNGQVSTEIRAAKTARKKFTLTITAPTGITSQQEDYYDVYEAVDEEDITRAEDQYQKLYDQR